MLSTTAIVLLVLSSVWPIVSSSRAGETATNGLEEWELTEEEENGDTLDLDDLMTFRGFHWTGSDRYHSPSALVWEEIDEGLPNNDKKGPKQKQQQLQETTPTPTPTSLETPTASKTEQTTSKPIGRYKTASASSSSSPASGLPSWFNKEQYASFQLWYFKTLTKHFDLETGIGKLLTRCYLDIAAVPLKNAHDWRPFDFKTFYKCMTSVRREFYNCSYENATLAITVVAPIIKAIQETNACFDLRRHLPIETIVTKSEIINGERNVLIDPTRFEGGKDIPSVPYWGPFSSLAALEMGSVHYFPQFGDDRFPALFENEYAYIHRDSWDHIPLTSQDVKKIIRGSCAVVSGSSTLLNSEKGAEIDAHETVVRFSSNPIKGYEKYVGAKTTLRPTSGAVAAVHWNETNIHKYKRMISELPVQWLLFWENRVGSKDIPEAYGLYQLAAKRMIELLDRYAAPKFKERLSSLSLSEEELNEKPYLFLSSQRTTSLLYMCMRGLDPFSVSKRILPTSGLRAILALMPYCDSIDLYGFDDKLRTSHYYSNITVSDMHDMEAERRFVQMLEIQGLVKRR